MRWQAISYVYDPFSETYLRISLIIHYPEKFLTNFQLFPIVFTA